MGKSRNISSPMARGSAATRIVSSSARVLSAMGHSCRDWMSASSMPTTKMRSSGGGVGRNRIIWSYTPSSRPCKAPTARKPKIRAPAAKVDKTGGCPSWLTQLKRRGSWGDRRLLGGGEKAIRGDGGAKPGLPRQFIVTSGICELRSGCCDYKLRSRTVTVIGNPKQFS